MAGFVRLRHGAAPDSPWVRGPADLIVRDLPRWEGPYSDFPYWLFGTRLLRGVGGPKWTAWRAAALGAILPNQAPDGSWAPVDRWRAEAGRADATAALVLTLCAIAD
jgi:hypothetical protein